MSVDYVVVIAVRPPDEGKSRLAPALDTLARATLVEAMFRHVLHTAIAAVSATRCHVVSRSAHLLDLAVAADARPIRERRTGLNQALTQASELLADEGPILALSADLPLLGRDDICAMGQALDQADVVVATDRAGTGTNAMLLRKAGLIPYSFGKDSLARHRALAEKRGLRFCVVDRPGLGADIDEPADLALLPPAKTASKKGAAILVSSIGRS